VKKTVSKFAFRMQPAALHRGITLSPVQAARANALTAEVGLCTLNQVDP
jgi:hypothetical protein